MFSKKISAGFVGLVVSLLGVPAFAQAAPTITVSAAQEQCIQSLCDANGKSCCEANSEEIQKLLAWKKNLQDSWKKAAAKPKVDRVAALRLELQAAIDLKADKSEIEALSAKFEAAIADLEPFKNDIKSFKDALDGVNGKLEKLGVRMDNAEKNIAQLQSDVKALQDAAKAPKADAVDDANIQFGADVGYFFQHADSGSSFGGFPVMLKIVFPLGDDGAVRIVVEGGAVLTDSVDTLGVIGRSYAAFDLGKGFDLTAGVNNEWSGFNSSLAASWMAVNPEIGLQFETSNLHLGAAAFGGLVEEPTTASFGYGGTLNVGFVTNK